MKIPYHLTCLLRNLYGSQEATVRTGHGTTDWFQIGKKACQGCILSLCLFKLYADYIMKNAWLDEAQAGTKIAKRNINNLRYANDTILMPESLEWLKSLSMKVEQKREKAGLKVNIQKTKIMASGHIISWQKDGETMETVRDLFSVQFSHSVVSDSLRPHESQHARPPCPSPTPAVHSDSRPLSQWCHPAISSSVVPFSSCPNLSQHQSVFQWVNSSHEVAKVLEFQLQHQSFQWTPRTDLL